MSNFIVRVLCRAAKRNRRPSVDDEESEEFPEELNSEEVEDGESEDVESKKSHSSSASTSSQIPTCYGGVLALDGRDGHTLWEVYAGHEVHSLTCEHDLNRDNVTDCVAAGRYGAFLAIDSVDGSVIWTFKPTQSACL